MGALGFTGTKPLSLVRQHQGSVSLVPVVVGSVVVNSLWITCSVFYFLSFVFRRLEFSEDGGLLLMSARSRARNRCRGGTAQAVKADCWHEHALSLGSGSCLLLDVQLHPEGLGIGSRLGKNSLRSLFACEYLQVSEKDAEGQHRLTWCCTEWGPFLCWGLL